ncbi:hypothetical protein FACS1894132_13310 [Clostridia bacterium]|nr:hypothetical protein FACS1894132_13310 [Clostridia bacterium]
MAIWDVGLFCTSQQIATKVIEKLQDLPSSRQKTVLTAYAHYELGCASSAMGDYATAAKKSTYCIGVT